MHYKVYHIDNNQSQKAPKLLYIFNMLLLSTTPLL